jgi:HEAT repeat protein
MVLEVLLSNSKHPAYWVRKNVLDGLGEFNSYLDRVLPVLIEALEDEEGCNGVVSDHAVEAIGSIGPAAIETLPILFEKFKHQITGENTDVIRYIKAVGCLGKGAEETLEKMNELLKEHYYDLG